MTRADATVGITCRPDHPVFSAVADRLRERGIDVSFLDPTVDVPRERLVDLDLFVHKATRPASVRTLLRAERAGVPTWNSAGGVLAILSRHSQHCALEAAGFDVPPLSVEPPAGRYVAKSRYQWGPSPAVGGEGEVYEPLLDADPVDYKYYVVHDGATYRTRVVRATSKLLGEKSIEGVAAPRADHVERITTLMDRLGMRAMGVDVLRVDGRESAADRWVAVDVNPCPSFRGADLLDALVGSVESSLP